MDPIDCTDVDHVGLALRTPLIMAGLRRSEVGMGVGFRQLTERNRPTGAGFSFAFATSRPDEKTSQVVCFSIEIALGPVLGIKLEFGGANQGRH